MTTSDPKRGEIWLVDFDPSRGNEIQKTRPALVVSVDSVGTLPLRIVVPITTWQPKWSTAPWIVYLKQSQRNGLSRDSGADCFQVKSISVDRFVRPLGVVTATNMQDVAAAVRICIGA
ncbi:MAG: type II toxin-antitoxin system PemK/MazF family toxin [Myxococcales bacterium]|nr:type II toxin-antitoxin system PemK/MazF family toxin [Myxococcales bacterium]